MRRWRPQRTLQRQPSKLCGSVMLIERKATAAVLSQMYCAWLSLADTTRFTGHRATAASQVLQDETRHAAEMLALAPLFQRPGCTRVMAAW